MIYILFILNIFICIRGFLLSFNNKSFLVLWWAYIFYYAILYFIDAFQASIHEIGWYSNARPIITTVELKEQYYLFITLVNIVMFIALRFSKFQQFKHLKTEIVSKQFLYLNKLFIILFFLSIVFLLIKISSYSYSELTSSADFGGWPWVFVQVSMSIVVYLYYKKNYKVLFLVILLSLAYTILTFVRSIFLYSIFTLIYLYLSDIYFLNKSYSYFIKKIAIPTLILGILSTSALLLRGSSELNLPDSQIVNQSYIVFGFLQDEEPLLLNDYIFFFKGLLTPFDRFFVIETPDLLTSPVQNARILFTGDISHVDFRYFFHYPNLFYNQFYSSFGWFGIFGGFVLVKYFLVFEKFVRKSYATLFFFLPIFSWHIFMVFRGGLDISTMGIAYALWIQLILFSICKFFKLI